MEVADFDFAYACFVVASVVVVAVAAVVAFASYAFAEGSFDPACGGGDHQDRPWVPSHCWVPPFPFGWVASAFASVACAGVASFAFAVVVVGS